MADSCKCEGVGDGGTCGGLPHGHSLSVCETDPDFFRPHCLAILSAKTCAAPLLFYFSPFTSPDRNPDR
eukprot:scaffold16470_cov120-Isochrysis_galbana.AAC.4